MQESYVMYQQHNTVQTTSIFTSHCLFLQNQLVPTQQSKRSLQCTDKEQRAPNFTT